jgi:hypothetical protein
MNIKYVKRGIVALIAAILIITVLEFPPPIGLETRSQANVSIYWLFLFLAILISEIATIPLIFKRLELGWKLGVVAGFLNILQVIADQLHLMQPEVAPPGYTMLEYSVGIFSLVLIFLSLKVKKQIL